MKLKTLPIFLCLLGQSGPLLDIAFILDGSTGSRPQFDNIKNLVKSFVSSLDVSKDKVHIGIIEYGSTARIVLPFESLNSAQSINQFIDTIGSSGGYSRVDRALAMTKNLFKIQRGYRPGVSKVAVLVTNSRYIGRNTQLQQAVQELRRDGVRLYIIGSNIPNEPHLQIMAPREDITRVTRFLGAERIVQPLVKHVRDQDRGRRYSIIILTFSIFTRLTMSHVQLMKCNLIVTVRVVKESIFFRVLELLTLATLIREFGEPNSVL